MAGDNPEAGPVFNGTYPKFEDALSGSILQCLSGPTRPVDNYSLGWMSSEIVSKHEENFGMIQQFVESIYRTSEQMQLRHKIGHLGKEISIYLDIHVLSPVLKFFKGPVAEMTTGFTGLIILLLVGPIAVSLLVLRGLGLDTSMAQPEMVS